MDKKDHLKKVGVIGAGFVGRAIIHGFILHSDIKYYDKYQDSDSLEETVRHSDFIFVCVPTPMSNTGKCDISIVEETIYQIGKIAESNKEILIKSTVPPGTCRNFQENISGHRIWFNPEFLTERTSKLDFINTARIILGGKPSRWNKEGKKIFKPNKKLEKLFRRRFPHTPMYWTSWEAAELLKYICNGFFALKISYLNEVYDIAKNLDVDFDQIKKMFLADMRVGNSHTDVPGHDGKRGYGGKCFPKDVAGIIHWAKLHGLFLDTLEAAQKVNDRVRPEKDWEEIPGATFKRGFEND